MAVADSAPNDGAAPVVVGMSDAAMHMYDVAIDALPAAQDPEFADRTGVILVGPPELIEAVEVEEPATEDETSRIKDLIAALGG